MENSCKIAEAGLINMLREMNNPLTSIRLCIELLEIGNEEMKEVYYSIIKKSTDFIESAVREISDSFLNEGFSVQFTVKEELVNNGL